jgi:SpoVK/Ycf46/Vps4 family AAA+-type ATPase
MTDIIERWDTHITNINSSIHTMWNFIIYQQFTNSEIDRLNKKINELTDENNIMKIKRALDCDKEDDSPPKKKFKKIIFPLNLLKNEYRFKYNKTTKYKFLSSHKRDELAKTIYKTIKSIEDIIKLKDHKQKYDFINDEKFTKLYNIIPALEELNLIIGMKNVKEKLFNSICYFLHSIGNKDEMNHVMLMGQPGVGKTTIAKIIGSIYLQLGFLTNDNFIVAKRSDLIAKYLGQTAIKTQKVIDSALGGVLFIDEVYSLGNDEKRDSFAKECIDTINLNMSRTDEPWLLIVGGYKDEIEKEFLAYNKGLERRFTVKLEIENYTAQELFEILLKFIKEDNWQLDKDSINVEDIEKYYKHFKYAGGDMRKLLQLAKEHYSIRNMQQAITLDSVNKLLIKDDFTKSLEQFVKKEEIDKYYYTSMYS